MQRSPLWWRTSSQVPLGSAAKAFAEERDVTGCTFGETNKVAGAALTSAMDARAGDKGVTEGTFVGANKVAGTPWTAP